VFKEQRNELVPFRNNRQDKQTRGLICDSMEAYRVKVFKGSKFEADMET
jgi:hypothetical protein